MSDTKNHKLAIAITRSCRKNKGLITDIYYKILEDHPAAIVNAFEALKNQDVRCEYCNKITSNTDNRCDHCGIRLE